MDRYTLFPDFKKSISQFLAKENSFVIGYDNNNSDSITTIVATLQKNNYQVRAVNIQENLNLDVLPEEIVCLTTPPEKNLDLVKGLAAVKVNKIWLEPGSESTAVINFCKENNINLIYYHSLVKEIMTPNKKK